MYSTIGVKGSVLEKFRAMKEAGFEGVEPMGGMKREEVMWSQLVIRVARRLLFLAAFLGE
jgi:hypothetical protein